MRSYLACDHRVPERYRAGFVQHMYVRFHVVTVDGFGRTGVQVGRRATDHLLASVAHSSGTPAAGHAAKNEILIRLRLYMMVPIRISVKQ